MPAVAKSAVSKVDGGREETQQTVSNPQSLSECLAMLDSLQEEMHLPPTKVPDKEASPETDDQKYLELIDLLTNKMFESDPPTRLQAKSRSLPRSGCPEPPDPRLRKSSSQVFSPSRAGKSGALSAYERLFGVPSPSSSRCSSPAGSGRRAGPAIIPKAKRKTEGGRPCVLGRLGVQRQASRSEENISLGAGGVVQGEDRRKDRISLTSIDNLLAAPGKIVIPARYQHEQVRQAFLRL